MDLEEKLKKRDAVLAKMNKEHGANSINLYSKMDKIDVEATSSGSLSLDLALGVGGYAKGRIIEIYGPEASGKTTLTLHAIAEAQKKGGLAAFIDAEHALDAEYAKNLGVDMDNLTLSQPDNGEQALEMVDNLIESGVYDVIVIDSVAALVPKAEIEGEMGDSHMGLQARLMSQALRKLNGKVSKTKTVLIFINQIRMKIGVMFGNPETTTGGNALKFYASQRIDIRRTGSVKEGENVVANTVKCKVVKNKVSPPFKECLFEITFGKGINKTKEVVDAAVQVALIDKAGAWYKYEGEVIGQGATGVVEYFESNPEFASKIEAEVRKQLFRKKE